jgi:hypothetical protein
MRCRVAEVSADFYLGDLEGDVPALATRNNNLSPVETDVFLVR